MKALMTEQSAARLIRDLAQQVPGIIGSEAVPGLSLALIRDGKIISTQAFGIRKAETQQLLATDTVFEAASLSKPLFGYGALMLVETGALDLDKPLADYLAEPIVPGDPRSELATPRHVLSHMTGLPNWRPKGKPLRFHLAPGERFSYSGEGFSILQAVVEHITGVPAAEHVRINILEPLGMMNSRFTWPGEEAMTVAVGHEEDGTPKAKELWPNMVAAASLHSTPADFAKFMCAVMRPVKGCHGYLTAETLKEMFVLQNRVNDSVPWQTDWPKPDIQINPWVGWGLGWGIQRTSIGDSIWHWGDNVCYRAFAVGFPETGHGVVFMTNGKHGQRAITRILREIIGGDYPALDWLDHMYCG